MSNGNQPSLNDLYEKIGKVQGTLNSFEKKVDAVILDFGTRINNNEDKISTMKGRAMGIAATTGFFGGLIGIILGWFSFRK